MNPVIYYLRTSRFRSAFKQFLKDPFGSSDFKQKPTGAVRGRRGKIEVKWRKNNNEKAVGPCGVQPVDGSQPREKYPSERRNAMVILSTDNLQDQSYLCQSGESGEIRDAKGQRKDHRAWKHHTQDMQKPCEENEEQTGEENKESFKKGGSGNESRQRQPGKKIHPMQDINLNLAPERERQMDL